MIECRTCGTHWSDGEHDACPQCRINRTHLTRWLGRVQENGMAWCPNCAGPSLAVRLDTVSELFNVVYDVDALPHLIDLHGLDAGGADQSHRLPRLRLQAVDTRRGKLVMGALSVSTPGGVRTRAAVQARPGGCGVSSTVTITQTSGAAQLNTTFIGGGYTQMCGTYPGKTRFTRPAGQMELNTCPRT